MTSDAVTMCRMVLRSRPVLRAISLTDTPVRYMSLIMNRSSIASMVRLLQKAMDISHCSLKMPPCALVGNFIPALLGIISPLLTHASIGGMDGQRHIGLLEPVAQRAFDRWQAIHNSPSKEMRSWFWFLSSQTTKYKEYSQRKIPGKKD